MTHNAFSPTPISLRPHLPADLPILFEYQRDPLSNQMAGFPARERDAFDQHYARIMADPTCITLTILAGDAVVGSIGSFVIEGERDVGYWIGREFWGQGIATAALGQFLQIDLTRPLYARVVHWNPASARVLAKCGFEHLRREGDEIVWVLR